MGKLSEEQAEYIANSLGEDGPSIVEYRNPTEQLGFARMPHILGMDGDLSDGAYRTYAVLQYFAQRHAYAYPSLATLAALRGKDEQTVKRHLRELADKKLITRERRFGTSSITYLEDMPEPYTESARQVLEKRTEKRELADQARRASRIKNVSVQKYTDDGYKNEPTVGTKMYRKGEQEEREQVEREQEHAGAQNAPDPLPPKPASHKPEEPKPEKAVVHSKKSIEKESLFPVAAALADVCQMELCANRGRLFKEAKQLVTIANVTPDSIREHYGPGGWWFHGTWRSKEGGPPTPGQIRQTWGQWLIPKVMPLVKPTKKDILAEAFARWDEELQHGKCRDHPSSGENVLDGVSFTVT